MAARLMVAADAGILCDQVVYGATKERITYEVLAPIQVKGRETLAQMGSTYSQVRSALSVCQWL